jgi:DNA-binding LacI/PurR family transcriptional regulator
VPWSDVLVMEAPTRDSDAGAWAMTELLNGPDTPTAVFACSDQLALGALRAARSAGIRVPRDMSVVGFDDSPSARYADPPLSTVGQPLRERGQAVGALVRALLQGAEVASPAPAPVRLVVRGSTGPPAAPVARGSDGT